MAVYPRIITNPNSSLGPFKPSHGNDIVNTIVSYPGKAALYPLTSSVIDYPPRQRSRAQQRELLPREMMNIAIATNYTTEY